MDKEFYERIKMADILELLKFFLTHEDPNVRARACSAIGNMCRHSSYFYGLLAKHNIITLLVDRCSDRDKRTQKFACFAALLKLVADYSVVALNPSRKDAINESPLKIALF